MSARTNDHGQPIGFAIPDWKPCARPARSAMVGRSVRLEPLRVADHAETMFEAVSADDGSMWTYLAVGPFGRDRAGFDAWLAKCETSEDPLFYAVVEQATGRALGYASYLRIEPAVGVIEVGHITMSPALQRTVMATETMYLMMARVFDELGYRRYEWKCDSLNAPSRVAAKRLCFQYEGLFRQATLYKNRNRDTAWFSILDTEWPALKAAFRRWLDPSNFDGQGRQKQSLSDLTAAAASG
ncbi:putative GNAT-family acetyltransferase [alpha proteobacterium BAL199]|jgi:RimJ/RimL family protein N-acetyltransferase|nr:putative GNAT-family acetyltransferase [alpha proteobacterium BAL199]